VRLSRGAARLLSAVASIALILVNNESEAPILENNLIKLHQPIRNRAGLDVDEGYFSIALMLDTSTSHRCERRAAHRAIQSGARRASRSDGGLRLSLAMRMYTQVAG
jgi:excinuclease UvrABC nuclease subunit